MVGGVYVCFSALSVATEVVSGGVGGEGKICVAYRNTFCLA